MPARSEPPRVSDGGVDGEGVATSVEAPPAADAAALVDSALARGRVVTLAGECEVGVPGQVASSPQTRLVLLKPDGSVVVHDRDGGEPVVALSDEREPVVDAVDGTLEVAIGRGGAEGRIRMGRIDLLVHASIDSPSEPRTTVERAGAADGHESLRERVLAEPDCVEPGFRPLSTERETSAGSVDVYGRDAEGRAVVVEIKGSRAGPAAVGQLDRYVTALRKDLHADAEVRGVLVAPSATDRTHSLLDERGFAFRALSPRG